MSEETVALTVTLGEMAVAFEAWENDYRATPHNYMTSEQIAESEVSQLSADRAAIFYALLTTPTVAGATDE